MAMDPISLSPLPLTGGIRPAQSLQGDLASVLRQGRIVAGEVLELLDGGTIVIGLAGQRVQAESHVELAPGDRFLARVAIAEGELVLQLATAAPGTGDLLLTALRNLAGSELDRKGLFETLQQAGARPEELPEVFQPELGGAGLALALRRSGLFQEAGLVSLTEQGTDPQAELLATERLARQIVSDADPSAASERPALVAWVREELAQALAELKSGSSSLRVADVASSLRADLVRALAPRAGDAGHALVRAFLAGLDSPAIEHAGWLPWVALMLGDALDFGERSLRKRALVQLLQEDFKTRLIELVERSASGEQHDAAEHGLRALEAEQLRNVARRQLHEALHVGFLVPDGDQPANAHLLVPLRRDGTAAEPELDQGERITVGVEYSRLGSLRAEILLQRDRLHVRLRVANPATAELLRRDVETLTRDLGAGRREVGLAIVQREGEDPELDGTDLAFLREHHLMDLSG